MPFILLIAKVLKDGFFLVYMYTINSCSTSASSKRRYHVRMCASFPGLSVPLRGTYLLTNLQSGYECRKCPPKNLCRPLEPLESLICRWVR